MCTRDGAGDTCKIPNLVTGMLRLSFLLLRKGQSGHRNKANISQSVFVRFALMCTCIRHVRHIDRFDRRSYEAAEGRAAFEEIVRLDRSVGRGLSLCFVLLCCAALGAPLKASGNRRTNSTKMAVTRERGKNCRRTLLPKLDRSG